MTEHPEDMALSAEEAIARAESENYAYFMESSVIEYVTARRCNLTMVGGLLDSKGYGIAIAKGKNKIKPIIIGETITNFQNISLLIQKIAEID